MHEMDGRRLGPLFISQRWTHNPIAKRLATLAALMFSRAACCCLLIGLAGSGRSQRNHSSLSPISHRGGYYSSLSPACVFGSQVAAFGIPAHHPLEAFLAFPSKSSLLLFVQHHHGWKTYKEYHAKGGRTRCYRCCRHSNHGHKSETKVSEAQSICGEPIDQQQRERRILFNTQSKSAQDQRKAQAQGSRDCFGRHRDDQYCWTQEAQICWSCK